MIILSNLEFFLKILQHLTRYGVLFCGVFSVLINICHPFLEGLVFTMKPPHYNCPTCKYCPVNNTFMVNHFYLPFLYAPLHIIDMILAISLIYVIFTVRTSDNRAHVIARLLFFANVKLFVMGLQVIEMTHTGGGISIELVRAMQVENCWLTHEQKMPAYWLILRIWFFTLNVASTVLANLLVLGNKLLARWYQPLELQERKPLVENDNEGSGEYTSPFEELPDVSQL